MGSDGQDFQNICESTFRVGEETAGQDQTIGICQSAPGWKGEGLFPKSHHNFVILFGSSEFDETRV